MVAKICSQKLPEEISGVVKLKIFLEEHAPRPPSLVDGRAYTHTVLILSTCPPNIWALTICPPGAKS